LHHKFKIYFAGSIRGGRNDANVYKDIIDYLQKYVTVLTEHVGLESLSGCGEDNRNDTWIYNRDMDWINEADALIAEVTNPSLGVGYEIGQAQALKIPVLCLFNKNSQNRLSAMVSGNQNITVKNYQNMEEVKLIIKQFIYNLNPDS
jgi:nucleoside 2-deoxyribosyltransferase